MSERISLGQQFSRARSNIARNFTRLFRAQSHLLTGKQILRPSDGAAQTGRLFSLIRQEQDLERFGRTIETGISRVDLGAGSLQEISDQVSRARELTIQAANGIQELGDRGSIATEIDQLLGAVIATANARVEDNYLFGGTETTQAPFIRRTGADGVERVFYVGNGDVQEAEIGPGVLAGMNIPGDRVFPPGTRTGTLISGLTGVAPGTGTDSGTGTGRLQVIHDVTAYGSPTGTGGADPVSGIAPGSLSGLKDTVIGNGHSLVITSDASGNGTISLNGGSPVSFTNLDTNLEVVGANGERVFVDTTGVAPNLAGITVSIGATGSFSLDGGQTKVPIDSTNANQQVLNSETGAVLHVDPTNVRIAGEATVTYEGTDTLFDALIAIRDILRDGSLTATEAGDAVRGHLDDLDRAHDDLLSAMGELGARHNRFEASGNRIDDLDLTIKGLRSGIEDADIAEVTLDVSRFETLYQTSLLMASRIGDISLLNFI